MSGMRWVPGKGVVWDSGIQSRIFLHNAFTPDAVNYGFYGDGTEAGASLLPAAQDLTYDADVSSGNFQVQVRVQIDETGTDTAASAQNYSLEYELNDSTTWVPITTTSVAVQVDTGSTLTDGTATTDRLTGGAGTFGAGEVDGGTGATGTTGDLNVPTASNHTEIVWGLNLIASALADNDTIDFRVLADGATFAATMGQPRLTITAPAAFGDIIQSPSNSNNNQSSLTVTLDTTAVSGNLLVVCHFTLDNDSTAPAGFSEAIAVNGGDQGAIYYKISDGTETAVTVGSPGIDDNAAAVVEIEGPWESSPLDQTASNTLTTETTTSTGTTGTTSQDDEVAVGAVALRSSSAAYSNWTNSFVERAEVAATLASIGVATKLLTATGTVETSADHVSAGSRGMIATFKKQAAAGGRLLLINPPAIDGGFGGGLSL